jgi:hypothetical protein
VDQAVVALELHIALQLLQLLERQILGVAAAVVQMELPAAQAAQEL